MHCVTVFLSLFYTQYSCQLRALWCILIKNHCIWCVRVIYLVQKTAWQLVNRKADFFTKWIDSHNESNRIDSNREWNALTDTDCLDHAGLSLVQVFPELHNFLAEETSQLLWTFNYNLLLWRQYRNHFPVQWVA